VSNLADEIARLNENTAAITEQYCYNHKDNVPYLHREMLYEKLSNKLKLKDRENKQKFKDDFFVNVMRSKLTLLEGERKQAMIDNSAAHRVVGKKTVISLSDEGVYHSHIQAQNGSTTASHNHHSGHQVSSSTQRKHSQVSVLGSAFAQSGTRRAR
jgi:hypothetical protein